MPKQILQGMTNTVGISLSVGDTTWRVEGLQLVLSKTHGIGDMKYNI